MRYPLILAVLLVVAVAVVVLVWRRSAAKLPANPLWVANTALLRQLPSYMRTRNLTRAAAIGGAVALVGSLLSFAVLASAPVSRRTENSSLASRDIVLCLDASGSMLPYDGQILDRVRDLNARFHGERLSLQVWSAQTVTKLPLTDDYDLIEEVLSEAADVIDSGYLGEEDDYVLVSYELSEYLNGIDIPDTEIASLVGDGIATCVAGFDNSDQDRSRTIILATDNLIQGESIYSTEQALDFAGQHDIDVIALYPTDHGQMTTEGEELQRLVEARGGTFYEADDPDAIDAIMEQIESQQMAEATGESRQIETDTPRTALTWGSWLALLAVALLGWRRL